MEFRSDWQKSEYQLKVDMLKALNSAMGEEAFILNLDPEEPARSTITYKGNIPVQVHKYVNDKQYNFYINEHLPYIRYYSSNHIEEQLQKEGVKKPQNVGVLTRKKILQWVDYLTIVYKRMSEESTARQKAVASFLDEVKREGGEFSRIDPNYLTTSGQIVRNGIEFKFSIGDEGYISKDITIHYSVRDTIENFKALSENQYKAPTE